MNTTNEPQATSLVKLHLALLTVSLTPICLAADEPESPSSSRFSDQPAPLMLKGFPERPPPLLELGDKFLGPGNLQRGFTLPTGANWTPNLWVYGNYRTAVQTFDPGNSPRTSEWANRLDLFGNLQLSGTERVLVGFRPIDRFEDGAQRYSGYNIEPATPKKYHAWQDEWRATPNTFFFEGEFGEIFPKLDQGDKRYLDYGFSVGRQPLVLQDGLLVYDDSIDLFGITRNALQFSGASTLRLTGLFGWHGVDRANNQPDKKAYLFSVDTAMDLVRSTVEATALYVKSDNGGDGFYTGIGTLQRFGKFNTVFRIANSIAIEKESDRVRNGTVLFSEISFDPRGTHDLVYLNAYWGIDEFSSADRGPMAGGPMGRAGILNADVELGRYGSPLNNYPGHSVGANLGYQKYFGPLRRTQLILEIGGRVPTKSPALVREEPAAGIGARYQKAFGRRFVVIVDAFGVVRENQKESYGGRLELLTKF